MAIFSIGTFCRRTSSRSRSSGPSKYSISTGGGEARSAGRLIARFRYRQNLLAVAPRNAQKISQLAHEVAAVGVYDLEPAGSTALRGLQPNRPGKILEASSRQFGDSRRHPELPC